MLRAHFGNPDRGNRGHGNPGRETAEDLAGTCREMIGEISYGLETLKVIFDGTAEDFVTYEVIGDHNDLDYVCFDDHGEENGHGTAFALQEAGTFHTPLQGAGSAFSCDQVLED